MGFLAVLRRLRLGLGHATRLKFCLWCLLCPATGGYRAGAPARQGFMPAYQALPCRQRLSIAKAAADHDRLIRLQYSSCVGPPPYCTAHIYLLCRVLAVLIALLDLHIHMHT